MNLYDLIIPEKEAVQLPDVFLKDADRQRILQLIKEHAYIARLQEYGLPVNNKVLLHGQSGCGKTTTAKAIAGALGKNIITVNLSNVICSRIGETAQNIKMLFDKAARERAVLFLDEFDHLAKERSGDDKDVGEMRRLVNTLIQLVDHYPEHALLLCATNHLSLIDTALLRRFQVRINYETPTPELLNAYYDKLLARFPQPMQQLNRMYNVSFAEARDYAFTHVKSLLLAEWEEKAKLQ